MSETELTAEHLRTAGLNEQFTALTAAVTDGIERGGANIAVIAPPYACRDRFLDAIEREFADTGRVAITDTGPETLPSFPERDIVLVDDCQLLYQREIGGFDTLRSFRELIARRETLFVATWNRYAWTYLTAVTDIDSAFREPIEIPPLDPRQVSDLLQSYHEAPFPEFVELDDRQRVKTVDVAWESTTAAGVSVPTPTVSINPEYTLPQSRTDVEADTEAVVYQTIANLSVGAPRVAVELWDQGIRDGTIAPGYIKAVDQSLDIDHETAFVLEVVVTNEAIPRTTLSGICGERTTQQATRALLSDGVVTIGGDGTIRLKPTQLHSAITHLKRRQLVW